MSTFTASNGAKVHISGGDWLTAVSTDPDWNVSFGTHAIDALREFFLRERDDELGRWRDPQFPEFVAYWHPVLSKLTVIWEPQGGSTEFKRDDVPPPGSGGLPEAVARAYFDAHPEPKPWHDAKPGEVWVLTVDGSEEFPCSVSPSGPDFEPIAHPVWATLARGSDRITSARRIWPEEPS